MNVTILCVGRLKDRELASLIEDYSRRLGQGIKLRWLEVRDEKLGAISEGEARAREKARLFEKWPDRALVVALDQKGKAIDSPSFARLIQEAQHAGRDLAFVIGGPIGLDPQVHTKADKVVSLSRLTFPHRLVRLILIEQIYRAFSILRGEPYHK